MPASGSTDAAATGAGATGVGATATGAPGTGASSIAAYDFALPAGLIAQSPARPRDSARLLHVAAGGLGDRTVRDLPSLLRRGDILVANDTQVIPAQLAACRGEARVGITLDQPAADGTWHALARNARRLRAGDVLRFAAGGPDGAGAAPHRPGAEGPEAGDAAGGDATAGDAGVDASGGLTAVVVALDGHGGVTLRFDREGAAFDAALRGAGALALPPYIARAAGPTAEDASDYQTVFARHDGAVAAPTAGLHFTPALLAALDAAGIGRTTVTLHVGAGTFLPMREDSLDAHTIHAERGVITGAAAAAINAARARGGRVVAVGTTSLRLLESAVGEDGLVRAFRGETRLFVRPGHRFRAVDLLLTNFHLPRSTLFVLVCAFAGAQRMRAAYAHAVAQGYRFYSYGDASLLEPAAASRDG